ncbi:MSMEG_0565 family glycosyltransferase [Paenibacillus beijingensis]|uniref:Glycosyl transferase family 1 n=1 Tax=Paenibacillus beijingensis TaxID=1126833 RepID=A0A0D5NQ79_9BACL|nr:MSMEG_0565 family glycosyltransferase [Paenibacillus beijingensis]AJY77325.1 glycosyl transferase family 1 [Paenibacillus beijingensis]
MLNVALFTYNTKPRGGVVHTLALAEALCARGCSVTVFALGLGGSTQFYRPAAVPTQVFSFPPREDESLESRILRYIDTYTAGMEQEALDRFDIFHAQDCISANCLNRLQQKGLIPFFIRTVHHLDDFVTPSLVSCQQQSVVVPKALITVSQTWRQKLQQLYERSSAVIHNGVDDRFFQPDAASAALKTSLQLENNIVFLTLGGIEPRKNTIVTLQAFAEVKRQLPQAALIIAGGSTLFDYRPYRLEFDRILERLPSSVRGDIRIITAPDDATVQQLYQLSDVYLQPSLQEGWGLAVLEAMASGTPVVASSIDVFREFLTDGFNACFADPGDPTSVAAHMLQTVRDKELQKRLTTNGKQTAAEYSWLTAADRHIHFYRRILSDG